MAFGWTWRHIDTEVTLPMVFEIQHYWETHLPIHEMIAGYFNRDFKIGGVEGQGREKVGNADDLLREFGEMGGTVDHTVWD
jgi:hypothetical protein